VRQGGRNDRVVRAVYLDELDHLLDRDRWPEERKGIRVAGIHTLLKTGSPLLWRQLVIAGTMADPLTEAGLSARHADCIRPSDLHSAYHGSPSVISRSSLRRTALRCRGVRRRGAGQVWDMLQPIERVFEAA
jgi:hypothetical protein